LRIQGFKRKNETGYQYFYIDYHAKKAFHTWILNLNSLFYFSGTKAPGTHMHLPGTFISLHSYPLQIGHENPFGSIVGMADVIACGSLLSAY